MANDLESRVQRLISADAPTPGLGPNLARGVLGGLSGLYDAGLETYLAAEKIGLRRRTKLPIPVLSVGNLSVGGTGKTPMTQFLCRRLQAAGKRVAVLSRGHGGTSQAVRLVSDGAGPVLLSSQEAGDEPVLLARSLPSVPVLVGKDRRLSGREALRRFGLEALVLDDGFQYWQLARDLDIVLLDSKHPFENGYALPRGLLREPARHLRRAALAVVTRTGRLDDVGRARLSDQILALAPEIEIYFADHRPACLVSVTDVVAEPLPFALLQGISIIALSAIAQPRSFFQSLRDVTGAEILREIAWPDHHAFTPQEAEDTLKLARSLGAQAVVMTEKDAVKWPTSGLTSEIRVLALRIEMCLEEETAFLASVMERLFGAGKLGRS